MEIQASVRDALPGEVSPRLIVTAVSRQGTVFLWPLRLPGPDGRIDGWSRSAMEAANIAGKSWVRIASNMDLGAYDASQASSSIPDPVWPDIGFQGLINIAFKDKYIDTLDHPVLRRLRGEV